MYIPRKLVQLGIGKGLVIWVNPIALDYYVKTKRPNFIPFKNRIHELNSSGHIPNFMMKPLMKTHKFMESFTIRTDCQSQSDMGPINRSKNGALGGFGSLSR